jgi:hypothetical protein
MIFFFKKKKLVVDCFTNRHDVYKFSKVDKSEKFYPDWWKKLPKTLFHESALYENSTMKHCIGLINWYQNGIVIPMWSDLIMRVEAEHLRTIQCNFSDDCSYITDHAHNQFTGMFEGSSFSVLKFNTPWKFKCSDETQFIMESMYYNHRTLNQLNIAPGVIDFKYQNAVNILCSIEHQDTTRLLKFEFGEPLVIIRPISDREIVIKRHLIDDIEYARLNTPPGTFLNRYKRIKKFVKENESKCPFGFGK